MKITHFKHLAWLAFVAGLIACQEPQQVAPSPPEASPTPTAKPVQWARISPNINLDANGILLAYKNQYGVVRQVVPPWGSAAATTAPNSVRFDRYAKDGWVVVYNTFVTDQTVSRPVLALYNKYRGLLRWWWWNDQGAAGPSDYLTYAMQIEGKNTSQFNFTSGLAENHNVYKPRPYIIASNAGRLNQGLLANRWYYFDSEWSYDSNVSGKRQSDYSIAINSWATSKAVVSLTGNIKGNINGTIQRSGSGVSLFNNLAGAINLTKNDRTATTNVNFDDGVKVKESLESKISAGIDNALANGIKSGLTKLATGAVNFLTSPLSNVFSSIIGTSINDKQRVSLALSATVNLAGDITTNQPAMVFKGAMPGTNRGDQSGFLPYYNNTLGVFNLEQDPVVRYKKFKGNVVYPPYHGELVQYYLDNRSIRAKINPAVAAEASVSIRPRLIIMKRYSGDDIKKNGGSIDNIGFKNWQTLNIVGGNEWYGFSAPYFVYYRHWARPPDDRVVVQVKVTVTPHNGTPPIHIVKLFRAKFRSGLPWG